MIISLRGTSGAGKSHLMRQIMLGYQIHRAIMVPGRKKPQGYEFEQLRQCGVLWCQGHMHHDGDHFSDSEEFYDRTLYVPGHYEIANGGIDTLPDLDVAYALIWDHYDLGHDVIYEGKNMSDGVTHLTRLFDAEQVEIVVIAHPVPECVRSVRERGHKIDERSIQRTHDKVMRDAEKFVARGYRVSLLSREDALKKCRSLLAR